VQKGRSIPLKHSVTVFRHHLNQLIPKGEAEIGSGFHGGVAFGTGTRGDPRLETVNFGFWAVRDASAVDFTPGQGYGVKEFLAVEAGEGLGIALHAGVRAAGYFGGVIAVGAEVLDAGTHGRLHGTSQRTF
jgi:hypothetical protein